jgi:LCP family protein required for cell wall assembly
MSDGGNWYPGSSEPRYDPYNPPQPPHGYGRPPAPRQPEQRPGPGYGQGPQQPHGYGQQPPPPRGPRPPQGPGPRRSPYPEERGAPWDGEREPWSTPEPGRPADPWDEEPEFGGRSKRRGGAGRGPGRQAESGTGPGPQGPGHVNDDIDLDEVDPDGKAQRAWARQQAAEGRPKSRARQATKWTALGMCVVLLAAGGFVVYVYETTVGSIKHTALLPNGMTEAALPPDPYGNTAQNILLIGSDTRDTAADCQLGGDCGPGANADSEMILHVSAERTNATILSIPRDTEATLPNCTESNGTTSLTGTYSTYQINSALQYGPECQVAADHYLTGITITGYIMFDFGGIVTMSQALGGVPVCVTKAVDDHNSGLKLPAGTSTIEGNQALEFLRTRDSFFDGSDLGREEATHYFLSQLIQTMRTNVNFNNLGTLLNIAQAAAKATTVSDNYTGLTNLEGLVETLDKVPTKNITMLTMPYDLDSANNARVVPDPGAKAVFQEIQDDTSFTPTTPAKSSGSSSASSPKPAASSSAPPSVDDAQVPVNVYNADGVAGRASTIVSALTGSGFSDTVSAGNAPTVSASLVTYDPNEVTQADADAVASALGISDAQVQSTSNFRGVSVFIGNDFQSGTTLGSSGSGSDAASGSSSSGGTTTTATAPSESNESFASGSSNECIPVESGNLQMASK